MTSNERLAAALAHREPDRVPFDLGGALVTGINVNLLRRLQEHLGLPGDACVLDRVTQLGTVDDALRDRLRVDVESACPGPPAQPGAAKDLGLVDGHYRLIDEFGMGWQMPGQGGHYYDLYHSPLADAETAKDIATHPWPDPLDPARFAGMRQRADRIVLEQRRGLVAERMHSGMWEHAMWMIGYEKFFTAMALNPQLVHAVMSKELEIKMAYWGRVLDLLVGHTVVISEADDLGGQNGPLVSLDMYKRLIWPYHKRLFEFVKSRAKGNTKVYIFFHNDGAIYDTLPLLVEAGVDIINPWQVNCKGMDDTKRFKREWGRDLTVWGGTCDTQRVLPFGTPQEVRDETRRRIDDLAPGGGFVFAPIHILQAGIPVENVMAWWETLQEYGACDATTNHPATNSQMTEADPAGGHSEAPLIPLDTTTLT
jgi:uroporphyrinogen decarboxylase